MSIITENNEVKIRWFTYHDESILPRYINHIFTLDSTGHVQIKLNQRIKIDEDFTHSACNIDKYLEQFCDKYNSNQAGEINSLLNRLNAETKTLYDYVMSL